MDAKVLFKQVITQATGCFKYITDDQLGNSTPCTEWDLRALLNHLIYEVSWIPDLLAGKTVHEVGDRYDGDLLGKDFHASWNEAAKKALAAVDNADKTAIVHLSYGDVTAEHFINEVSGDVLIHNWDVAQSIKSSMILDKDLVKAVYDIVLPRKDQYAASGLFGTSIDVPNDASTQTKLLALVGRQEYRQ